MVNSHCTMFSMPLLKFIYKPEYSFKNILFLFLKCLVLSLFVYRRCIRWIPCSGIIVGSTVTCSFRNNFNFSRMFERNFQIFSYNALNFANFKLLISKKQWTTLWWNFKTIYGCLEPSRNRVVVPASQATQPGRIGSLESILGPKKSLKIRGLYGNLLRQQ